MAPDDNKAPRYSRCQSDGPIHLWSSWRSSNFSKTQQLPKAGYALANPAVLTGSSGLEACILLDQPARLHPSGIQSFSFNVYDQNRVYTNTALRSVKLKN